MPIPESSFFDLPPAVLQLMGWTALYGTRLATASLILPPMNTQALGSAAPMISVVLGAWLAWGHADAAQTLSGLDWSLLFVKESLIGLTLGVLCSGVFWVAQSVGVMLDAQTGFNNIQQTEPMRGEENTPLGNAFLQCSVALFHMTGGLMAFLWLVFDSYLWWPVNAALPDLSKLLHVLLEQLSTDLFQQLVAMAAGMIGVLVLIDWSIGLLNRVASKLDVNTLGQPIKAAVALMLLATWVQQDFHALAEATSLPRVCLTLQSRGLLPEGMDCR